MTIHYCQNCDTTECKCAPSSEQAQQGAEPVLGYLAFQTDDAKPKFFPTLTAAHAGVARWHPPVERIVPVIASRPAAAAPTAEQILALERRSPMSDDEALRFGRAVLLLAERAAAAAPAVGVTALREALQFYANGDHFTKHDPNAWDNVSGEPANLWEDEANTATVEDGSIARAALAGAAQGAPALPEHETEAMHDAVMAVLYAGGITRGETDKLWRAYRSVLVAGAAQGAEPSALRGALEEIAAMEYDKWSNGARAGEIARNALAMQSQSIPVTGATVADRLDAMADREQAGSQASSDLYAAATVWRKHLKAGAAQGAEPVADTPNDCPVCAGRGTVGFFHHPCDFCRGSGTSPIPSPQPPTGTEKKDAEPVVHQGMTIAGDGAAMLGRLMREQRASRLGVYPDGNPNAGTEKP